MLLILGLVGKKKVIPHRLLVRTSPPSCTYLTTSLYFLSLCLLVHTSLPLYLLVRTSLPPCTYLTTSLYLPLCLLVHTSLPLYLIVRTSLPPCTYLTTSLYLPLCLLVLALSLQGLGLLHVQGCYLIRLHARRRNLHTHIHTQLVCGRHTHLHNYTLTAR